MDLSTLAAFVTPIVTAVIAYLQTEGLQKAGEKASEVIGEKAGETVSSIGPKALATMKGWFKHSPDAKAEKALADVEQDPDDVDYQQKLVKEAIRVASIEPAFAEELKVLAQQANFIQSGGVQINNNAPNQGAQGVFNAPININNSDNKMN